MKGQSKSTFRENKGYVAAEIKFYFLIQKI